MQTRIAILGPESTGKTWLATKLAKHFNTSFVPEFSRLYFENRKYEYSQMDLVEIAIGQLKSEQLAYKTNQLLFTDTEFITLVIWSKVVFGDVPKYISDKVINNKYDLYLLSNLDVEWESDPLRSNKYDRQYIFNLFVKELELHGFNYKIVKGLGEDRLKNAIKFVNEYLNNAR